MKESKSERGTPLSDPHTWVDRHGDPLYHFALAHVRDASTAQDLVQDTFLAALRGQDQFSGLCDERTWLISILKRKIVDHLRRSSREQAADIDVEEMTEDADFRSGSSRTGSWKSGRHPVEWFATPDNLLEAAEFRRFLRDCLKRLPDALSRAFILREVEETPPEEVCNVLDVSATNLRVMMYRARKSLRRCLEIHWLELRKR